MRTKNLFFLAIVALLTFASCTDEVQEMESQQSQFLKQIVMTTQDFELEANSRTLYQVADGAVQCTWAANDTVGVFPNEGGQVYFPMVSGEGAKNATFHGGGWALKDGSVYGAYYPFVGEAYLDRNAVPVNYIGQTQVGNGSMAHLGTYDYMVAPATAPEFGSANFMFKHLSALVQLKLTVPKPATLTSVKLVAETEAFAVKGKVDIMVDKPSITPIKNASEVELILQEIKTTEENQVVTLYMMLPPADLSSQTLKAVVSMDKGLEEIILDSKNFQAGKVYGLFGELEGLKGTYKDGVVSLAKAGTMKKLLGNDYLNITELKVIGPINGDDVYYLRKMAGYSELNEIDKGKLSTLDLSDASIVEGGEWYYEPSSSKQYYTTDDMIGDYMFYKCAGLQNIVLPDNITSIGYRAFSGCSSLISFKIPNGVDVIAESVFSSCSSLTFVYIPESITSIGNYAFYGCSSLTTIDITDNVTSIGEGAFSSSGLISVDIPDSVIKMGVEAFSGCKSLTSVTIGDGVKSIGIETFYSCISLTNVVIGDSVTSIGHYAFEFCSSLDSLTIGKNVTSIGYYAFYGCTSLTQCYCYATNPPTINAYDYPSFPKYKEQTILYVPLRYGAKYNMSNWGKYFLSITEMD